LPITGSSNGNSSTLDFIDVDTATLGSFAGFNIKDQEFSGETFARNEGKIVFVFEVFSTTDFDSSHGYGINKGDHSGDLCADEDRTAASQSSGDFRWENNQIVFTDSGKINRESVLVMAGVVSKILGDELLGMLNSDGEHGLQEINESLGVRSIFIEEIDTFG